MCFFGMLTIEVSTYVVSSSDIEIVEHIIGDCVLDVVAVDVQCGKHDADPDLSM